MKQVIFRNWTLFRLLRTVIGMALVVQAILEKDALLGIAAVVFTCMAIFDISLCTAGGCYMPAKNISKTKEVSYEEVV